MKKWWTRGLLFDILPKCRTKRSRAALIRECNAIVGICIAESTDSKNLEDRSAEAMPSADADGSSAESSEESSTYGQDSMSVQPVGIPDPSAGGLKFDGSFHGSGSDEKSKSADQTTEKPKKFIVDNTKSDVVSSQDALDAKAQAGTLLSAAMAGFDCPILPDKEVTDAINDASGEYAKTVNKIVQSPEGKAVGEVAAVVIAVTTDIPREIVREVGKSISKVVEFLAEDINVMPPGMTFATPNGPALVGAVEAVPAAVEAGAAAAHIPATINTAVAGDMAQDLSLSRKIGTNDGSMRTDGISKSQQKKESIESQKYIRENWHKLDDSIKRQFRDNFVESKVKDDAWSAPVHKVGGRPAWQDKSDKNIFYTKDTRHKDIEVWHVTGKKANHEGSIEPIEGTMYKGPEHAPQRFE